MIIEKRLAQLALALPAPPAPLGAYVPAVEVGNLLFLSGMLPIVQGRPALTGRIGGELGLDEARSAVRCAVLNALSAARHRLGSLDRIQRVVRLAVYQATGHSFSDHAKVADAGSEMLGDIFGDKAAHSRLVFGVSTLPGNMPVELEIIFQIDSECA